MSHRDRCDHHDNYDMANFEKLLKKYRHFGLYQLRGGQWVDRYFDLRALALNPDDLDVIAGQLCIKQDILDKDDGSPKVDYVACIGTGGTALASRVAMFAGNPPLIVLEGKTKTHGMPEKHRLRQWAKERFGSPEKIKETVGVLCDDVCTTGTTFISMAARLHKLGFRHFVYMTVIQRKDMGNMPLQTIIGPNSRLLGRRPLTKIKFGPRKSRVCLSVDGMSLSVAKQVVRTHRDKLCAVKIHPDLYGQREGVEFNHVPIDDWLHRLASFVNECHNLGLPIIADMKYNDISRVVLRMIRSAPFFVGHWADYITVSAMPGLETLKKLRRATPNVLLIRDMTTTGTLTAQTSVAVDYWLENNQLPHVVGIISAGREVGVRDKMRQQGRIVVSPGVRTPLNDTLPAAQVADQNYQCVNQKDADVYIAGSAVTTKAGNIDKDALQVLYVATVVKHKPIAPKKDAENQGE